MRLIVIGGGAAGFFCAVNAARMNPALEVTIVEKTGKLLSKVRISGGGRCNVTHACFSIPEMMEKYPRGKHFIKKTFHSFFTTDTIEWFRLRGVLLKTENDGRMFPVTDHSETIIDCLMNEARKFGVKIRTHSGVRSLKKEGEQWVITFENGETEECEFICIACGGYPKTSMFGWLLEMGHTIEDPVPSLFTFNVPSDNITALMGVSHHAKIKIRDSKFEEEGPVLITHWGVSGPAVLRLSARAARKLYEMNYRFSAVVNWAPAYHEQSLQEKLKILREEVPAQKVRSRNGFGIPNRLWEYLCLRSGIEENTRWADLSSALLIKLADAVCLTELKVEGKTTYKEEFVTAGGIRLNEVNPSTMESRIERSICFAGEILDVDGVTGGFNFQHAWTSGWIAAKHIADSASILKSD